MTVRYRPMRRRGLLMPYEVTPGPGQVQRQFHDPLGWPVQSASEAHPSE